MNSTFPAVFFCICICAILFILYPNCSLIEYTTHNNEIKRNVIVLFKNKKDCEKIINLLKEKENTYYKCESL